MRPRSPDFSKHVFLVTATWKQCMVSFLFNQRCTETVFTQLARQKLQRRQPKKKKKKSLKGLCMHFNETKKAALII